MAIDYSKSALPKPKPGRVPPKNTTDGIKKHPDGREECMTDAAWQRRRMEAFHAAGEQCQFRPCLVRNKHLTAGYFACDHIRKRSVGRDDRLENLRVGHHICHDHRHKTEEGL